MDTENILDELIELAGHQAKMVLMELHEQIVPSWVILTKDQRVLIHATPWQNDREKELAALYIKKQLRKHGAVAYSFLMEAWRAAGPPGWSPEQRPLEEHERPRERVDRQETVVAFATDGKSTKWASWIISRDWKGDCDKLIAEDHLAEWQAESWIAKLL